MKKSTLLLTICLALSNCSTSIESKSSQELPENTGKSTWISQGDQRTDYNNFIQNQTIIGGELLTLKNRGREVDIVPQLSERMKSVNNLPVIPITQKPWSFGIKPQVLV